MSNPASGAERWVTATALQALAALGFKAGQSFTSGDLAGWARTLTPVQRVHATSRMCALGFVTHQVKVLHEDGQDVRADVYTVTKEGAAAIEAAFMGEVRKSGPKTTRKPNPVPPGALVSRLWALLRMRGSADSDSAAQLLCDAGQDFEQTRATVRKYLRRWCTAGALAESSRRIGPQGHSNGVKRYVLVQDAPTPPAWRQLAKASQGAPR